MCDKGTTHNDGIAGKAVTGLSPVSKWNQGQGDKEKEGINDQGLVGAHR